MERMIKKDYVTLGAFLNQINLKYSGNSKIHVFN
jgi:ribosome-associated protein YbcJ (S4-like RNA binding protein)